MTHDPHKKTLRHFQCRDYLWEIFEQMSAELECSTDYLVNEAMRQYARSRNYGVRTPSSAVPRQPGRPESPPGGAIPSLGRPTSPPVRASAAPPPPPPRNYGGGGYGYGAPATPAYPSPPPAPYPGPATQRPSQQQMPAYSSPATHRPAAYGAVSAPPPLPNAYPAAASRPMLFVIFNGQKIPVSKDEFIIGRGSKTADLPIKDGNISRRHSAIVFQDGAWWIRDLGSTNGMEYAGRRIDAKRLEEGDTIHLCDYELRFTYR